MLHSLLPQWQCLLIILLGPSSPQVVFWGATRSSPVVLSIQASHTCQAWLPLPHVQICTKDVQPCRMGQHHGFAASGHPIPDYTLSFHLAWNILLGGGSLCGTGWKRCWFFFLDGLVAGRLSPWSLIRGFRSASPCSHLALQAFLWSPFFQIPCSFLAGEQKQRWCWQATHISRERDSLKPGQWWYWQSRAPRPSRVLGGETASGQADCVCEPASVRLIASSVSVSLCFGILRWVFLPPKSNISYLYIKKYILEGLGLLAWGSCMRPSVLRVACNRTYLAGGF